MSSLRQVLLFLSVESRQQAAGCTAAVQGSSFQFLFIPCPSFLRVAGEMFHLRQHSGVCAVTIFTACGTGGGGGGGGGSGGDITQYVLVLT